ncbi:MAG: hydrogenase subunit MbhD domain-containing protein [Candidatus Methanofastidiosia archaeon]
MIHGIFLLMFVVAAFVAVELKNIVHAVIAYAFTSLTLSVLFFQLQAIDVAMTEASIGAALTTVIFILTIKKVGGKK